MRTNSRTVLGLDLGQHSIKAVLATANGTRVQVRRTALIPLPYDLPDPAKIIRKWLAEEELAHVPAVMAVGGSRLLYQHFQKEEGDPRTPEQIAAVEAVRFGDMTDARMMFTSTPCSPEPGERRILISLVRPDLLDTALKPGAEGGLKLVNVCPAPVALYNGVTALGEPIHQPTLIADLGAHHTEVVIGNGRGVVFARSFAMGTAQLTLAVASQGKIPPGQAERARIAAAGFAELPGGSGTVCEQFALRWAQEIKACLQMHQSSMGPPNDSTAVRRVILTGGGGLWEPLYAALKQQLPLPLQRVGRIAGHEDMESAPFLIAAGLAADALGIARAPSSLLPDSIRATLTRERNKRHWAVAALFSVLGMGMITAATHISALRESAVLSRHNETLQRCENIAREIEAILSRMTLLEQMNRPLVQFVENSSRIRDLTLFLAANKGSQDFLTFLGDSESYLELRVLADAPDTDQDPQLRTLLATRRRAIERRAESLRDRGMNRLIVEGYTPRQNFSTVKSLIEALREHPSVARADLLPDDIVFGDPRRDEMWSSTRSRRFVLDLRLVNTVEPLPSPPDAAADTTRTRRPR